MPADALIYGLQYRLRSRHYNRRDGFGIGILNTRARGDGRRPQVGRPVVSQER